MNIFKRIYYRLKYPGLPNKFTMDYYTNLVADPTDLSTPNWKEINIEPSTYLGEQLTVGQHETVHAKWDYLTVYEGLIPDNVRTENQIKAWLKRQVPIMVQKKNQQGTMFTKYRKVRYAKDSRMYIRKK